MDAVSGVTGLRPEHGPAFAVIGVFDGLHLGHAYLLDHLVREARARSAQPMVITFDHHPDEVITGSAPPLLIDPAERLERLADAGVAVTVVQHFDDAVRHTTYDAFVRAIADRAGLAGLLMTPDAAFGFERRGTPDALRVLGAEDGFDVVVVEPFTLDGRPVRSGEIRNAIAAGDLASAAALLGRPVTLRGRLADGTMRLEQPHALPPVGDYPATIDGVTVTLSVGADGLRVTPAVADGPIELRLT
ncbi:MAG: hypothetical protein ACLGIJ_03065 [Candidatus Limnocylindria bacterium]